jgi:hypothetical protein
MVDRHDPARTGVKAGRVVGLLTALLVVASLFSVQDAFLGGLESVVGLVGIDPGSAIDAYFYLYVALAALARYAISYVVGSLVGVVYDWLDHPPVSVLIGIVLVVGVVDGVGAVLETRTTAVGVAYVLAWLCYVPVFVWLLDEEQTDQQGPLRLDEV